jgi:hypothetical protein
MTIGTFLIVLIVAIAFAFWLIKWRRAEDASPSTYKSSSMTTVDFIGIADEFLYGTNQLPIHDVAKFNMQVMQISPEWAELIRHFQIIAEHLKSANNTNDTTKQSIACINALSELHSCDFSIVSNEKKDEYIAFVKKSIEPFSGYYTLGDTKASKRNDFISSVEGMVEMHGAFSRSPNDQYWLVRQDSDIKRGVGGFRHSGNGRFALLKHGKLVCHGECERPSNGVVSNAGIFAIDDTLFGDTLGAKLLVYSSECRLLFSHKFNANIFNMGISDTGNYVVVQLCNSDNDDANKLYLFDINNKKVVFAIESSWSDSYRISEDERIVYLNFRNFPRSYRCTFNGELLDADLFESDAIDKATGAELFFLAQSKYSTTSINPDEITRLLDKSIETGLSQYPEYLAKAYRIKGEICESAKDIKAAIQWYEKALETHEKVGVKRKLTALKKMVLV